MGHGTHGPLGAFNRILTNLEYPDRGSRVISDPVLDKSIRRASFRRGRRRSAAGDAVQLTTYKLTEKKEVGGASGSWDM